MEKFPKPLLYKIASIEDLKYINVEYYIPWSIFFCQSSSRRPFEKWNQNIAKLTDFLNSLTKQNKKPNKKYKYKYKEKDNKKGKDKNKEKEKDKYGDEDENKDTDEDGDKGLNLG